MGMRERERRVARRRPKQQQQLPLPRRVAVVATALADTYSLATGVVYAGLTPGRAGLAVLSLGALSVSATASTSRKAAASITLGNVILSASNASGDWVSRSTGAGVVWAHNFEYEDEVTQHLLPGGDPKTSGVIPRRVVDSTGIGCLEQVALGAELAATYTAGATTMVINDATYWPNPATDGSFYFMACRAHPSVGDKNVFLCTARSGVTLTVAYVASTGSAFATTPQSYAVGDYLGNEITKEWRRTFSALPATENGLPTNDPAASGAVPLRSKLTGNALSVPHDTSLWQYGWYGHASNQSTWANWTPWTGTSSYTARGVAQGAADKFRLWDGNEFYIQFRLKIDPRYYTYHAQPDPDGTTSYWGRKGVALQSEVSSLNQLVSSITTSNRFFIPTTTPAPFSLNTYKATKTIGADDYVRSHKSYQLNSPWDVAPHFADLSSSFKPSTGCATPDGSAAWEYKSGEWVTFLFRVKPGRSGVSETEIDISFARTEDTGYDGTYTALMSVTDAKITYSGSGDFDFPDGSFTYPTVQTMDALPGYQAFGLMGYFNITQTASIPPPKASYYVRMAQVILSRATIPAPSPDTAPWAPASGEIKNISLNTRDSIDPKNDPLANPSYPGTPPWEAGGYAWNTMTAFCGAVLATDIGLRGTYMQYGGAGHSAVNANHWIGFDLVTQLWARVGKRPLPSNSLSLGVSGYPAAQFNQTWGEWQGNYSGWPSGFAQSGYNPPEGSHTRNSFIYRPAEKAGNDGGEIVIAWQPTGMQSGTGIKGGHVWDADTELFSRHANERPAHGSDCGGMVYFEDLDTMIGLNMVSSAPPVSVDVFDCATKTWTRRTTTNVPSVAHFDSTSFEHAGYYILCDHETSVLTPPMRFYAISAAALISGSGMAWSNQLTVTATTTWPTVASGLSSTVAWALCPENGKFYAVNRAHGSTKMWRLTPPSNPITGTWVVDELTMTVGTLEGRTQGGSSSNSFDYSRLIWSTYARAFIWTGDYVLGAVQALRPPDIA